MYFSFIRVVLCLPSYLFSALVFHIVGINLLYLAIRLLYELTEAERELSTVFFPVFRSLGIIAYYAHLNRSFLILFIPRFLPDGISYRINWFLTHTINIQDHLRLLWQQCLWQVL